ncbi:signal recognition particle-docking protein FtsY [Phyllobacterium sp. 0TCS1.6A]|uniref:signal recognition particle-docking protein FtsY n=1 Tax=Phyllobacterium sp. 0TCS1.6A TaxID=2995637 RepID=UPI0022649A83|nr:signal recognition particle-docking protein FtsY [Phyllobacterium sp. 0TCS1.6A]MCX8293249.1 signal recognition particle-docking protein FtsY [Phyllobacterium sp. 0TCS1.6A]
MALGFIKKIFSFGKKEVEEIPEEAVLAEWEPEAGSTPVESLEPQPAAVAVEPEPEASPEAIAPEPEPEPDEPEILPESQPVVEEPIELPEPEDSEPVAAEAKHEADSAPEPAPKPSIVPESPPPPVETAAPEPDIPASAADEESHQPQAQPEQDEQPARLEEAAPEPPAPEPEPVEQPPLPQPVKPVSPKATGSPKVTVAKTVEAKREEEPAPAPAEKRLSWFERLRKGLSRSSQQLGDSIGGIFTRRKLDEDTLQDLEDVLIQADLGMETAIRITGALSATRYGKDIGTDEVRTIMASEIEKVLAPVAQPLELDLSHKPHVILVVGVNGTGKTTTIGKLAAKLTAGGLNVMLAAGDTFRAAAIEQLHIWGQRTGSPVVSSKLGADAAGLAFDAWQQAKEAGSDVLIIDTAGRLQNRAELMDELAKIVRVLGKHDPEAPHTVLQTLDATTGQNALNQVEIFRNVAGVNGLVMTKLDGTARGGILVAISAKHKLPVYFIGVGEQVDDLEPFAAQDFAKAIAGVA